MSHCIAFRKNYYEEKLYLSHVELCLLRSSWQNLVHSISGNLFVQKLETKLKFIHTTSYVVSGVASPTI
jgi:hypothetical protein